MRQSAAEEVGQVCSLLGLKGGERILDMPCGIGRHTLELARRGHMITAVDRTAGYLDELKRLAAAAGVGGQIETVQGDMREFRRDGAFDAGINLYTSFGYFEDPEDDRRVMDGFFASLRPGGQIILEMVGREALAKRFRASDWHEEPDGTIVLEQRALRGDWGWIDNRWVVIRGTERYEIKFGHRLYGATDLRALLEAAGFGEIRTLGSLGGIPYDQDAQRLVVIGRKP